MKYAFSNAAVRRADHWEVVKELGGQGGGMTAGIAIVRDIRNGTTFIEKRVKPEDVRHGLLAKEVNFLQQLKGCFLITKITDFYSDHINLRGGIIMEFCELGSLADLVERHGKARQMISEVHVWPFFIQIADALAYCHYGPELRDPRSRDAWDSIIHRDIKPANILITRVKEGPRRGQIVAKLADFGCAISKQMLIDRKVNPSKQSAYTEVFRPPEFPSYKYNSDVWQLGTVIICLCRLIPHAQKHDPRRPVGPDYSDSLDFCVRSSMHPDTKRRGNSDTVAKELCRRFEEVRPSLPRPFELVLN